MEIKNKETYWSRFVDDFEQKQQHVVGDNILFLMKDELLREQDLGEVLELGCGTGLFTEALQKVSKKVVATDFSEEMVAAAQETRANLKNVQFEKADALNLEFKDESFDAIFMANLIHVIGNAERVIRECNKVLKKNGVLIVTSFAIDEMNVFSRLAMGIRYLKTFGKPSDDATKEKTNRKIVETLLIRNGFEISKSIVLGKKSKAFYIRCIKS